MRKTINLLMHEVDVTELILKGRGVAIDEIIKALFSEPGRVKVTVTLEDVVYPKLERNGG